MGLDIGLFVTRLRWDKFFGWIKPGLCLIFIKFRELFLNIVLESNVDLNNLGLQELQLFLGAVQESHCHSLNWIPGILYLLLFIIRGVLVQYFCKVCEKFLSCLLLRIRILLATQGAVLANFGAWIHHSHKDGVDLLAQDTTFSPDVVLCVTGWQASEEDWVLTGGQDVFFAKLHEEWRLYYIGDAVGAPVSVGEVHASAYVQPIEVLLELI